MKLTILDAIKQTLKEKDLMEKIADRASKIASKATEHLIKKDFALDGDYNRMENSAHNLARYLAAGMAMITIIEFTSNFENHLTQQFTKIFENLSLGQGPQFNSELITQAAKTLAQDNSELVVNYVQKQVSTTFRIIGGKECKKMLLIITFIRHQKDLSVIFHNG